MENFQPSPDELYSSESRPDKIQAAVTAIIEAYHSRSRELPRIPEDITMGEVVPIISDRLRLPKGAERILINSTRMAEDATSVLIETQYKHASELKKNCVDSATGLETGRVLEEDLGIQLEETFIEASNLIESVQSLSDAINLIRGRLTDEYITELDTGLFELNSQINSLSREEANTYIQRQIPRLLRRTYMLSRMSSYAIIFTDARGVKGANQYHERKPRRGIGSQQVVDMVGFREMARASMALSEILGDDEYSQTLEDLNGTETIVWYDSDVRQTVTADDYRQRAINAVDPDKLNLLRQNSVKKRPFRFRAAAGDEGAELVFKTATDSLNRNTALTEEELRAASDLSQEVSTVIVGEYSEAESREIIEFFNNILGDRNKLTEGTRIPVLLQYRAGIVRLDVAFKTAMSPQALAKVRVDPEEDYIMEPVKAGLASAETAMEKAKETEEKRLLQEALNGDPNAQALLAVLHKSSRFPGNPGMLKQILAGDRYKGQAVSDQDMEEIYQAIRLRESDRKEQ